MAQETLSNDNILHENKNTLVNTFTLSRRGSNYNQVIAASVIKGLKVIVQPCEYDVPVKNIFSHI